MGAGEDESRHGDLDVLSALVITGAGAKRTVIDANGTDRALHVLSVKVRISRLTVTNGRAGSGGGILVDRGTLVLARTRMVGNTATGDGGGIFSERGRLAARDSTFLLNETADDGGAIATNRAGNTTRLERVRIAGNSAEEDGGGVEIERGPLTLINGTVAHNRTRMQDGGGIEINNGSMRARNSAIVRNISGDNGGGIENDTGFVTLVNTTISGNRAKRLGGGVDQTVGPNRVRLFFSTSYRNRAGLLGGGVSNRAGNSFRTRNCIIASNLVKTTSPVQIQPQDCAGVAIASLGYNLGSDNTCALTQPSDVAATDPRLVPLALNGARTPTHALLTGSPAIDTASGGPSTDQRGVPRPQGSAPDRGAFELE